MPSRFSALVAEVDRRPVAPQDLLAVACAAEATFAAAENQSPKAQPTAQAPPEPMEARPPERTREESAQQATLAGAPSAQREPDQPKGAQLKEPQSKGARRKLIQSESALVEQEPPAREQAQLAPGRQKPSRWEPTIGAQTAVAQTELAPVEAQRAQSESQRAPAELASQEGARLEPALPEPKRQDSKQWDSKQWESAPPAPRRAC